MDKYSVGNGKPETDMIIREWKCHVWGKESSQPLSASGNGDLNEVLLRMWRKGTSCALLVGR